MDCGIRSPINCPLDKSDLILDYGVNLSLKVNMIDFIDSFDQSPKIYRVILLSGFDPVLMMLSLV